MKVNSEKMEELLSNTYFNARLNRVINFISVMKHDERLDALDNFEQFLNFEKLIDKD